MKWNDFLNPRSMLTPGVAGTAIMLVANMLWLEFMLPQKYTALILSFLFIIFVLMRFSASWMENILYFIFNGFIIFALAANTNFVGRKIQEFISPPETIAQVFSKAFISSLASKANIQLINNANHIQLASNSDVIFVIKAKNKNKMTNDREDKKIEEQKEIPKNQGRRAFFEKWF
ncbi:MAG: hypothetical protein JO149_09805 [Gammaproteobacteria bacterium]|nr:hypothetical protein [Gammaproteobacteria bacterium]